MKSYLTLKKGCFLTSSASFSLAPNRLSGFRLSNWKNVTIQNQNQTKEICGQRTTNAVVVLQKGKNNLNHATAVNSRLQHYQGQLERLYPITLLEHYFKSSSF